MLNNYNFLNTVVDDDSLKTLFYYMIAGVFIGGRLGYVIFYGPEYFIDHPIEVLYLWQGGMSFHGGFLGSLLFGWFYCKRGNLPFFALLDCITITAPIGIALGRLGNVINGELWGRASDLPWAVIFPSAGSLPRHPSQLYEMMLEGVALFLILWFTRKKQWPVGIRIVIFLIGYAIARIFCEIFREPDAHIGFLFQGITMGMILSIFMTLIVSIIYFKVRRTHDQKNT